MDSVAETALQIAITNPDTNKKKNQVTKTIGL
jgi:hypothetical protein